MKGFAGILLAASAAAALQAAEWNQVSTSNFEVFTTATDHDARQMLQLFEQVRAFFMAVKSSKVTTRLPVTIVGFRNPREYKPYALNEVATAYFIGDEQRDYIVMSSMGLESSPAAIHEYMHLLVRHSGLKWPVWLNEGFAEVYSTLKPQGGQIVLGSIPQGRTYALQQEKWMSLPALFAVGHDSPEYNEKSRAGILYAESWLLTHMLTLGTGYRDKFSTFAAQVSTSGSTEQAFSQVYGKTLAEVQKDMDAYYHSNSLNGVIFKTQFEKFNIGKLEPAGELELELTLAKLVALNGRFDEASHRLSDLAAQHKDSYEVEEALAYLEWRKGNVDAARQHFQSATERGTKNWKTYWDYARLLGSSASKESIPALRKTLELNPELMEARMMLGSELYRNGIYAQALITLREVKNVPVERAATVYLILAHSALQIKLEDEARGYAEQAQKYASKPGELESAKQLLVYLNHKEPGGLSHAGGAGAVTVSENRPLLRRQELDSLAPPSETPENLALRAQGRLTQLDCLDGVARIHVNAGGADYSLLIRKPDRIAIRNNLGAAVEMTCGHQDTPVAVEYTLMRDEKYETTGDVQSLEFLPQ